MKPLCLAVFLAALAWSSAASADAADVKPFKSEAGAQQHCPADKVVWGSVASGVYFFKDNRHFGKTPNGYYMCQKEAEAGGLEAAGSGGDSHF